MFQKFVSSAGLSSFSWWQLLSRRPIRDNHQISAKQRFNFAQFCCLLLLSQMSNSAQLCCRLLLLSSVCHSSFSWWQWVYRHQILKIKKYHTSYNIGKARTGVYTRSQTKSLCTDFTTDSLDSNDYLICTDNTHVCQYTKFNKPCDNTNQSALVARGVMVTRGCPASPIYTIVWNQPRQTTIGDSSSEERTRSHGQPLTNSSSNSELNFLRFMGHWIIPKIVRRWTQNLKFVW